MSEQTSQEPTMEEILASIRRIISEDEAPADAAAPAAQPSATAEPEPVIEAAPEPVRAAAPPEPEPTPVSAYDDDDDALELTQKVESVGDLDVFTPPPPAARAPVAAPAPAPTLSAVSGLVSEQAANAAASAFGQLSAAVAMPREGRTLEDVVREMLTPMLQQWLDQNLPTIVQQAVEAEVSRIARGRVG